MKRWIALLLCLVLMLSMSACSTDDGEETTSGSGETTEATTGTEDAGREDQGTEQTQETVDPGYDGSWAEETGNEAAAQISDPNLRQWYAMDMELGVSDDGTDYIRITANPTATEVSVSTRYNVCIGVREEAEAYADEMRYCGFTLNESVDSGEEVQLDKETWIPGDYVFEADNEAGYHCSIRVVSGEAGFTVTITKNLDTTA